MAQRRAEGPAGLFGRNGNHVPPEVATARGNLSAIQNWTERARSARYRVQALARQCGVSARTLQRHFAREIGLLPREWLYAKRMKEASELLRSGRLVKQTAAELAYKNQHHFSRDFRQCYGHPPSRHLTLALLHAETPGTQKGEEQSQIGTIWRESEPLSAGR